jgi:hypothetical protein
MPPIGPDEAALHPGQVGQASPLLFAGLIDDAAMFPPGNAPLERALTEHGTHRSSWYADLVGPLLVPASRTAELAELVAAQSLPAEPMPLKVGAIARGGVLEAEQAIAAGQRSERMTLVGVELPLASSLDVTVDWPRLAAGTRTVWWEVERGADLRAQLDRLAAAADAAGDGGAKLRTGGVGPGAFPAERELAAFLRHAIDVDLTFKLTAGLHHAVRTTDPATGAEQHGVLNGAEEDELETVLAERDPEPLVERTNGMSAADASVARAFWSSFGCCGVTDPIDELVALGLLTPAIEVAR